MDTLTLVTFQQQIGTRFRLQLEAGVTVDLELVDAADSGSTGHQEQFSALFQGPHDRLLPPRIYRL